MTFVSGYYSRSTVATSTSHLNASDTSSIANSTETCIGDCRNDKDEGDRPLLDQEILEQCTESCFVFWKDLMFAIWATTP